MSLKWHTNTHTHTLTLGLVLLIFFSVPNRYSPKVWSSYMAEMHLTTRCYRNRPPDTARDFLLAISCRPKARHYNWKPSMSPIDPLKNLRSGCPALQIGRLLVYSFLLFFFFCLFSLLCKTTWSDKQERPESVSDVQLVLALGSWTQARGYMPSYITNCSIFQWRCHIFVTWPVLPESNSSWNWNMMDISDITMICFGRARFKKKTFKLIRLLLATWYCFRFNNHFWKFQFGCVFHQLCIWAIAWNLKKNPIIYINSITISAVYTH